MLEILTPDEMAAADARAIDAGPHDGYGLMLNAGLAVAREALRRFADAPRFHILCGPGNNGGDGYVVARLLAEDGCRVSLWRDAAPRAGSDAACAAAGCPVDARPLGAFTFAPGDVVVDALFGAGLARPLEGAAAEAARRTMEAGQRVLAVDLPSGVSGLTGRPLGEAFRAEATVTFFRKKPGHLLQPGRSLCGDVVVADIGIRPSVLAGTRARTYENLPELWAAALPRPDIDAHKYRRGHVAVASGGIASTGAARLAAMAAARAGAGAVTVVSPPAALAVNAGHLTSIMVRGAGDAAAFGAFLSQRKISAVVLGPGFGVGDRARAFVETSLAATFETGIAAVVLDADALTSFADNPQDLFDAIQARGAPAAILTPHEGEFARLFPDLAADDRPSKLERARQAAARAEAVVVLKGPDTVIAAPGGRAAINVNGSPWLATAGSGDVLAGLCAGLAGQGMPAFEAACAAVWIHAEAGTSFGPGLIADDLPALLPPVLRHLLDG